MKKNFNFFYLLVGFLACLFSGFTSNALWAQASCIAISDGDWSSNIWACFNGGGGNSFLGPPACGDNIVILDGYSVTISSDTDLTGCASSSNITVNNNSTLLLNTNVDLDLEAGTQIFIVSGGTIDMQAGSAINIGGTPEANGPVTITGGASGTTIPSVAPIELLSFSAESTPQGIVLDWSTATETNNSHFEIERGNTLGNFQSIVTLDGAGNSDQTLNYQHIDAQPLPGTTLYRLKQTDFDGTFSYSGIVEVNHSFNTANLVQVLPNPVINTSILQIGEGFEAGSWLRISDVTGRTLQSTHLQAPRVELRREAFTPGIYLYTLVIPGQSPYSGKFIVN